MTALDRLKLPTTTKEFAQYLREIAAVIDTIPDHRLYLSEGDVEIDFYYEGLEETPVGLHFQIDFASTEPR
jgi:hypothetical protein